MMLGEEGRYTFISHGVLVAGTQKGLGTVSSSEKRELDFYSSSSMHELFGTIFNSSTLYCL